jgi:acetyl-CoA carboxylase carboxyl transferase subunit beta
MPVTVEIERRNGGDRSGQPAWQCPRCHEDADPQAVKANLQVCPHCGHHLRVGARERIAQLADPGSFVELWMSLRTLDPLSFTDLETYPERVREAQAKTGLTEAIVAGTAQIASVSCVLAAMDFGFMGGSMGSVVGEKLWRAAERAAKERLPLVCVCSSGGARMQEGILSLMQMAKTSCAVDIVNEARVPFVAILADPCTGGVVASFATLADICIAEPGALLAFSGPRVIAETTRETLPPDFGSAERNLALGHLDEVVPRAELRERVAGYLRLLEGGGDDERRTAGRARGRGARRLATAATRRVATLVSHARRPFDRGDREVAGAPEES